MTKASQGIDIAKWSATLYWYQNNSMDSLKNTIAALGFICFFSLSLLPVSMTVCGPFTARLLHHAKKLRHVSQDLSPRLRLVHPDPTALERDAILEEGNPQRNLSGHAWVARRPAGAEPRSLDLASALRFIPGGKVSTLIFQSVLNL